MPPILAENEICSDTTCTDVTKYYNDTCELTCALGYKLTSSDGVRWCTEKGTWSNPVKCELVTCPPIPTSDHDIYSENTCTSTRMVYNDTCTLTCGIGYNLTNSDGVRTCTEDGTWSNSVKCELITCPSLKTFDGELYNDTTCISGKKVYNDTCEVACMLGYILTSTDGVHTCTENGTWTNPVSCELVTCPPIPTSDHDIYSEYNCTSTRKVYNDTCTLTCGTGFNLTNSDGVRTCTENGTWSNSVKCELITCPSIKTYDGELYNDTTCTSGKKVYNDKCEVSCTLGYNLTSTDGVHTCTENGTWTNPVSCELITYPAITSIKGEIYNDATCTSGKKVYNDTCEVSCTLGYNLTSIDGVHMCAGDGTWTNPVSCELVTCPPISTSDHDIYSENNCTTTRMVYNDTCTLTCGIGYNLTNSDGVRTCTENGTWSNSVKCELITCPSIKTVDGELYNDTTCTSGKKVYNDTCEVSCTLGYNVTSSDGVRTCTENGNWTNPVSCELITCPAIKTLEGELYNDITCTSGRKVYNDTCEVSCTLGYKLTSTDGVHTCTENGNWTNPVSCKLITCPAIKTLDGELYNDTTCTSGRKVYNDTCEVSCTLGYKLTDADGVHTCTENGNWTNPVSCKLRRCPAINDTVNARLVSGAKPYTPNSVLEYECNVGYELTSGHLQRSCKLDGQWTGASLQCTEVVIGDPTANSFNQTIVYKCAEGHELIAGDLSTTCLSSNAWSGHTPICRIVSCGPLAPVAHALVSTTEEAYMTNVTYTCLPGFKPVAGGEWTRQCQADRRWSGTSPICSDGVRVNDTATYSCVAGYRLQDGNLIKVCNNSGQWQNEDPVCIKVHCGSPLEVAKANVTMNSGDTVGGKVMYSCNHGYERRSGEGYSRCQLNGKWTTPSLICEEVTCGTPPEVKNAVMADGCVSRNCTVVYSCDVGYEGQPGQSQCTVDGHWTPVSLNCKRIRCGELTGVGSQVIEQTGFNYEAVATMECLPGYHSVRGSLLRICLDGGAWSGTPLVCEQTTCLAPTNIIGGTLSVESLTVGSVVTYQLQDGYRHVGGDLSRTCGEDKLWNGTQPQFQEITCPEIEIRNDSKVRFYSNGVNIGSRVTYSCFPGYKLPVGGATCECLSTGNWSCGTPTCSKVTCGQPPTMAYASTKTTGLRYLDRATYTCESGYFRESPQNQLVCSNRALWEGDGIVCSAITCPLPVLPPSATFNVTTLTYKSQVVYSCQQGYSIAEGDAVRMCQANGTWSGELPNCQRVECPRPPKVDNTSWYEDKKSLRQRRIIYKCRPRYKLVSGLLAKECGPRGQLATEEEVSIFVPEDEEPKTKAGKLMAAIGFRKADREIPNVTMGAIGAVLLILPFVLLFVVDFNTLRSHLKMMKRNIQSGYRRISRRSTKVVPFSQ
ncbi:CUB and sushi domain-containing protein 1 [Lamellibrachia satsuma]|nr:CUB and sushi domain-containing protein 1 [Lamellibrachia satsuma]